MTLLEKDSYPNPPVVEVAWELRFSDTFNIDFEKIKDELIPKLIRQYPNASPVNEAGFGISLPFSESATYEQYANKIVGFELTDTERKNFIRLSKTNLVVITREHTNYRDFKIALSRVIQAFLKVFDKIAFTEISRIGLRYINVCDLPENNKDLISKYLQIPVDLNRFPISTIASFKYETNQQLDDFGFRSIYSGIAVEGLPKVLIDFDAFSTNIPEDTVNLEDNLLGRTTAMHGLIKQNFKVSITQAFIDEVMESV